MRQRSKGPSRTWWPGSSGTDRPSASAFPCRRRDPSSGAIFGSVQVPGAVGTHLAAVVAEMTGLDTWIENDTRGLAVAEHWLGRGRYIDTFAAVQTGDGLGAGLLLDGVIHRGRNGAAGEIGHTAVVIGGVRCACGKRGCWETVATLRWLRRTARSRACGARGHSTPHTSWPWRPPTSVAGALVEEYAEHHDRARQPRPDPRHRAHHPPR